MGKWMLQKKGAEGYEDMIPVIGKWPERARMEVERVAGERTRWKPGHGPKGSRDTPGNHVS